uniref:Secreted protein n=1 Tax=Oryza barthii TaxID=65489 RepID=A0A0D3F379_9ORYZ
MASFLCAMLCTVLLLGSKSGIVCPHRQIACVEKKRDGDHVFVESSHPLLVPDEDILHYYPLAKTLKSGGDRVSL